MFEAAVMSGLVVVVVLLAVIVWRLVRLERQRSEAAVASLATAIDDGHWTPAVTAASRDASRADASLASLFAPEAGPVSRAPAVLAVGGLVVGVGAALLLFTGFSGSRVDLGADPAPRGSSLELMSMRHVLDGDTLIISGLVHNPSESRTPALTAVVSAVDRSGLVVGRGVAQLDPEVLEPAKATSFRVSVADARDLGRYRLSFHSGNQVVPHVDRRSDPARRAMAAD